MRIAWVAGCWGGVYNAGVLCLANRRRGRWADWDGVFGLAITAINYLVFSTLRQHNAFAPKPRVLELGESNWYGDVGVDELHADIAKTVGDPSRRVELQEQLKEIVAAGRPNMLYEIARLFFQVFTDCASYDAIDPGTSGSKYRFDLNQPVPLAERFDVVANIGTGEHVFNVWQFYKTGA